MKNMREGIKLGAVYVMNVFDMLATFVLVGMYGIEIEYNPVGSAILENPRLTGLVKLVAVGFGLLMLHYFRKMKVAHIGINMLLATYCALTMYHLIIIMSLTAV